MSPKIFDIDRNDRKNAFSNSFMVATAKSHIRPLVSYEGRSREAATILAPKPSHIENLSYKLQVWSWIQRLSFLPTFVFLYTISYELDHCFVEPSDFSHSTDREM